MRSPRLAMAMLALPALVLGAVGFGNDSATSIKREFTPQELTRIMQHSPLGPPPRDSNRFCDDPSAARLGQWLFFDPRLSVDGSTSCATCHDPLHGFADPKPVSTGVAGRKGKRHASSLWNVAYNRWFFWDGRADSLWSQALKPIERSIELGGSRLQAVHLIASDPSLREAYARVFGTMPDVSDAVRFPKAGGPADTVADPTLVAAWTTMTPADQEVVNRVFANIGKAIAAYERLLVSRRSPFDAFVEGLKTDDAQKQASLSESARRGLRMFVGSADCRVCHSGPGFSDGEFHDIGAPPLLAGQPDSGRLDGIRMLLADPFNAAGAFSDDPKGPAAQRLEFLAASPQNFGQFKTPTLRNVAVAAPYMHQGQFATLRQVLDYYSTLHGSTFADHHQETILQPRGFSAQEAADLLAFLESLTDLSIDPALLKPPSGPLLGDAPR